MTEQHAAGATLYLVPTPLIPYEPEAWAPERLREILPVRTQRILGSITHFVVESEKSASRLLSRLLPPERFERAVFLPLNEHSSERDLEAPLTALRQGQDCAILSEAGMPCIADPGAALVAAAHRADIRVVPMGGDSSLIMALAASGLNGQSFHFLGYLPIGGEALQRTLGQEGAAALRDRGARIFIETPYRNEKTMKECIAALPESLQLCFAGNLGTDSPIVLSAPVSQWRRNHVAPPEIPAVFCFGLPSSLPRENAVRRTARPATHPAARRRR